MNYYEHHVGDYDSATAHLSILEDGVYSRLMRIYYRTEAPIPADVAQACRLVRAASKQERDIVSAILCEFFELREDGWHNRRCDEEIARFRDKQSKAKRSAEARWSARKSHSEGNAAAMRTHSEGNADGMLRAPVPRHQTPDTNTSEANASGADAPPKAGPPTDRDLVFANGVTLLTASGVTEKNARSFLAAQCKAHGERSVRQALDRCATERPIQPVPWLQADLAKAGGGATKSRHAGFETKDYREGVTADGSLI